MDCIYMAVNFYEQSGDMLATYILNKCVGNDFNWQKKTFVMSKLFPEEW